MDAASNQEEGIGGGGGIGGGEKRIEKSNKLNQLNQLNGIKSTHRPLLTSHGTSGVSPLQLAISTGDVEVVKALLLEAQIDPSYTINKISDSGGGVGSNALHAIAAKGGAASLVMLEAALTALITTTTTTTTSSNDNNNSLINESKNRRMAVLDTINSAGVTCMHLAARNVVSTKREAFSAVLLLVQAGASPIVKSAAGMNRPSKTPLQNLAEVHCHHSITSSSSSSVERGEYGESVGSKTSTNSGSGGSASVGSGGGGGGGAGGGYHLERFLFCDQFSDVTILVSRSGVEKDHYETSKNVNTVVASNATTIESISIKDESITNLHLHENGHDHDLVFIPSHRVILASQSEFFETLLSGAWLESTKTRRIFLSGCNEVQIRRILCFAYTGRLDLPPGDAQSALELLRLASRYRLLSLMTSLQAFCITSSCLTIQTAWTTYLIAIECGLETSRLKDAAVSFILQNFETINSDEDKDDEENNVVLEEKKGEIRKNKCLFNS